MGADDPYTTITESAFVARFLLDLHTDTVDTVANVDAFVELPDGSEWSLTILTVDEVGRLRARGKETGEVADGSYFWVVDQLVVPDPGVAAMTAAIRELVRSGDITDVGIRCDDPRPGFPGAAKELRLRLLHRISGVYRDVMPCRSPSVRYGAGVRRSARTAGGGSDIGWRAAGPLRQAGVVITMQRARVRWSASSRGAAQANARRGLCRPAMLPLSMPGDDVVIHEVVADEAAGYVRHDEVAGGGLDRARDLDLWLSLEGSALVVDRLPGRAAYPRQNGPARLFVLLPGQIGCYRANFRFTFTTCPCNPSWFYEDWLVLIANGRLRTDGFVSGKPDHDVDHRVHLYGGPRLPRQR